MIAKPLQWRPDSGNFRDRWVANGVAGGMYLVYWRRPGAFGAAFGTETLAIDYKTEAQAKAAAQRHADEVVAGMLSDDILDSIARYSDADDADGVLADRILSNRKGGAG